MDALTVAQVLNGYFLLDERDRYVLKKRYDFPYSSLTAISYDLNVSKQRVQQIETRAFRKIKEHVEFERKKYERKVDANHS